MRGVPLHYLASLQVIVEFFALKKLLHLCFDQHSAHINDLIHCQGETLHRVAELLLRQPTAEEMRSINRSTHLHKEHSIVCSIASSKLRFQSVK